MIEQPSEQRTRELESLHAMALAIGASLTLDEIATASMRSMLDASQADLTFLFLRDGDRLTLHTIMPPEGSARLGIVPEHRVGECLCGLAVREAKPIHASVWPSNLMGSPQNRRMPFCPWPRRVGNSSAEQNGSPLTMILASSLHDGKYALLRKKASSRPRWHASRIPPSASTR